MADSERMVNIGGNTDHTTIITGDNNTINHGVTHPPAASKVWNVPHARNPIFHRTWGHPCTPPSRSCDW